MHKLHRYKIYDIDSCYEHIFSKQLTTSTTAVFSLRTSVLTQSADCNCKFQVTLMPFTQLLLHPSWHSSVSGKLCSPSWPWSCCAFVPLSPRKQKIISPHMLERLVPQQYQEPTTHCTCIGTPLTTSIVQRPCPHLDPPGQRNRSSVHFPLQLMFWCTKS